MQRSLSAQPLATRRPTVAMFCHSLRTVSRTFHINLQKGCCGCQFDQFSARPLNDCLDISASNWHNSGVSEDRSLGYYLLQDDVIVLSTVKHSLLGTTHTAIKYYITCGFVRPHSIKCDVSHVTKYPRLSPFLQAFVRMSI